MKLTTEKNILRTPEIIPFQISKYHLNFPELALQMIWTLPCGHIPSDEAGLV